MADKYLDEVISPFYSKVDNGSKNPLLRGQIYWTYYFYTHENLKFWRPQDYDDETKTSAKYFFIDSSTREAFNRKAPLHTPKLETNEEFIVTRAKRRPVILVAPTPERIDIKPVRGGATIHKNICIVAPLYGVIDANGIAKFPEEFINRVRNMEFPHLFFLPEANGVLRHSICRLDSIQTAYAPHLEPTNLSLSDDAIKVFLGQMEFFLTNSYRGDYQVYRESLMYQL